jgi:hypothetical protein
MYNMLYLCSDRWRDNHLNSSVFKRISRTLDLKMVMNQEQSLSKTLWTILLWLFAVVKHQNHINQLLTKNPQDVVDHFRKSFSHKFKHHLNLDQTICLEKSHNFDDLMLKKAANVKAVFERRRTHGGTNTIRRGISWESREASCMHQVETVICHIFCGGLLEVFCAGSSRRLEKWLCSRFRRNKCHSKLYNRWKFIRRECWFNLCLKRFWERFVTLYLNQEFSTFMEHKLWLRYFAPNNINTSWNQSYTSHSSSSFPSLHKQANHPNIHFSTLAPSHLH